MIHNPDNPKIYIPFLSLSCLSFIAGIIFARYISVGFFVVYVMALSALLLLFYLHIRQKNCGCAAILIFFLIGLLRQIGFASPGADDIYSLSELKLRKVSLYGTVASQIEEGRFGKSFVFDVKGVKAGRLKSRASGKVYVRFNKRINLNYGDILTVEGRLKAVKNEGYFNKGLIRKGIRSILAVGRKDWIAIHKKHSFSIIRLAALTKEKLKKRFQNISSPAKDFLIAFILGDRSGLDQEVYSVFKQTGTVHVLAISGLHIGIIIFILILFLKALRLKLKSRFVITILLLVFYSFMTGLRPSVVRAVIMGAVFLLSFLVKREYHIYNSLALSAMIILFIWPWQIFDIGFQLSFISVLGIVSISPKILFLLPGVKNRFLRFLQISLVISSSAWLATAPLVAYYFGIVSIISVVANLFVIPLTPFILAGGFIYLISSFMVPVFTKWISLSLEFMVEALVFMVVGFRNLPFSYFYVDKFDLWILFLYYALLVLLFNLFFKGLSK
ncbi:MAG: ComEC/Rec2 family competence protein [Candidatus Omnitrophica bacterium]|nr:ComEC/Rec2 family competence protein [Candidatus Omnitrophota bacterium]